MRTELKKLGLSENEVEIYLLLLRKGPLQVTQIARDLSLARSSVYRFITNLHEQGLVSKTIQDNVKIYHPLEPEKLSDILLSNLDEIKKTIPELNRIYNRPAEKTEVSVFRGKEGIKAVMNDIIKEEKPYTCFGEIEKYFQEMDIFTRKWMKEVEARNIRGRLIGSKKQKFEVATSEEYKYLPDYFFSGMTTVTYGDKSALFIWSKPMYVILINNKDVTKSNLRTFDHFWKDGEVPSKSDRNKRKAA